MSNRTVLIITGILFSLLIYTLIFEGSFFTTNEKNERKDNAFFELRPDKIDKIALDTEHGKITLKKNSEARWLLTSPVKEDADSESVTNLISAFDYILVIRKVEYEKAVQTSGILKSGIGGRVKYGSKTVKFKLGNETEDGLVYMQVSDDKEFIYVVSTDFLKLVNRPLFYYRNKNILGDNINSVLSFIIKRESRDDLNLLADGDDFFVKIDSNKVRANSEAKRVFKSLKNLKALKFVDSGKVDLKNTGLSNPKYSILINLKNKKSEKIAIGNSCGDDSVYLKMNNSIKCIQKSVLSILDMPVNRFADKNIAPFKTSQIKKVEIDKNSQTLILESDKFGIWNAGTLAADDTSQKSVQVFLDNLTQKKGYDIISDNAAIDFFNAVTASLKITLENNDIYKIDFLKNEDTDSSHDLAVRLSKNSQEEKILISVEDEVLDDINSLELKFRNKTIKNSLAADAEKIEITGILNQTIVKQGEHWLISRPVSAVAEHSTVEKIISMASNTEVEHFVDETEAVNPFSKNDLVLKVTFKSSSQDKKGLLNQTGTVTVEMTFGNEASDSERYCKIKGKDYLFTVNDEFYKSLTSPVASLSALRIKSGTAKKVEIKTEANEFTAVYDGKTWVSTGCSVDERSLERAIVVLEEMKALKAVSFGSDMGKAATSIKIYGDDMENPAVIEFSGKRDHINGCLARRTDLNVIYSVPVRVPDKIEELCR